MILFFLDLPLDGALGCDFFQRNAYTHIRNDCFFLLLCSKKKCAKVLCFFVVVAPSLFHKIRIKSDFFEHIRIYA